MLKFHGLFCFQLAYFILLNPSLIWDVDWLFVLLPTCSHLVAASWINSWMARCRGVKVNLIFIIDVLFKIILSLLVFVGIIVLNVFIVCIVVWCLLRLLILGLLMLGLVIIADSKVWSNYLDFCILLINWFLRVHIGHHLRLFKN